MCSDFRYINQSADIDDDLSARDFLLRGMRQHCAQGGVELFAAGPARAARPDSLLVADLQPQSEEVFMCF